MAWQNSASMVANGGGPAGGDAGNGGQPQGTEYTLQGTLALILASSSQLKDGPPIVLLHHTNKFDSLLGVMRFLQTEWHRHERDRNAWEIERAEMKSRIGKLEGDGRTSKRMQETLGKHVKILENALRREREKVKKLQLGDSIADTQSDNGKENTKPTPACKLLF